MCAVCSSELPTEFSTGFSIINQSFVIEHHSITLNLSSANIMLGPEGAPHKLLPWEHSLTDFSLSYVADSSAAGV